MLQGLGCRGRGDAAPVPFAEGASGRREVYAFDFVALRGQQALEDGGMLRVHRQYHRAVLAHGPGDYASGGHKGLLVGERDYLARLEGGEGRPQTAEAHHGSYHDVHLRLPDELAEAVDSRPDLDAAGLERFGHLAVARLVADHHVGGVEFDRLADQQVDAAACGYEFDFEQVGMTAHHVESLCPDRTGGAEYCYSTFLHFSS